MTANQNCFNSPFVQERERWDYSHFFIGAFCCLPVVTRPLNSCSAFLRVLLIVVFIFHLNDPVAAQQKITGVVTGIDNAPLFGASVRVKGSGLSTITDANGRFAITAGNGDVVVISFVGYEAKEIKFDAQTNLSTQLTPLFGNLDSVIVVGYTSQKIKEIAGSVATVNPEKLTEIPAGQVEQMLQGRVAGLTVITSGEPGGATQIFLHGPGNFGDITPLYIIDGIQGDINSINPYDIESIQVLKDAGAYAIYGVRGANGVILVTTKKGKAGRVRLSYDFYVGKTYPLKERKDVLRPMETAQLTWLQDKNSGYVDSLGNPSDQLFGDSSEPVLPDYLYAGPGWGLFEGDPGVNPQLYNIDDHTGSIYQIARFNKAGTDWFHKVFEPALSQNHTLSASGGSDKSQYLFSLGYLDQNGTLLNTYLKRYTMRVNTGFNITNNFRIGENLQVSYRKNSEEPTFDLSFIKDAINSVYGAPEWQPVYDIEGNFAAGDGTSGFILFNPVAERIFSIGKDNKYEQSQITGNVFGELNFFKYFSINSNFGGEINDLFSHFFIYKGYASLPNGDPDNELDERSEYLRNWTWTNTLNFSRVFANSHRINLLIGTEATSASNKLHVGSRTGFISNDPNYLDLSNGNANGQLNNGASSRYTSYSVLSQLQYGIHDKYFLNGTLRRDGVSVFGPENRYGWFPSVSGAWRISRENFMKSLQWLNECKLRVSWGKTGYYGNTFSNNQYNSYGSDPARSYYDIGGTNSAVFGLSGATIGNPNTGWQQDVVTNIGLDAILWRGRLSINADGYKKKTDGLLFPAPLPVFVTGDATSPNINIGSVENTGIDLLVESKGNFSKNWNWDIAATFSSYRNKIIKIDGTQNSFMPNDFVKNEIGHPIGSFYGYKILGLFQDVSEVNKSPVQSGAAPGRFKFSDENGDGLINSSDRVFIGNPNPKFTLGLNIEIVFKEFDCSTFFYGSFGNDIWNSISAHRGAWGELYDSWTAQHTNTIIPRAEAESNFSNDPTNTSFHVENGSFLKNKSFMLGYSFNSKFLERIKVDKLRVYVQAVNLFTITNYTGLDPEIYGSKSMFGIDNGYYPNNQQQFLAGLSMNF
mgnify:FL=1